MLKIYNGLPEDINYEVNLNRICRSFDFTSFISARHKLCPSGLTVSCYQNEETGKLEFCPSIKHYGYDHIGNNGTAYSDMGDYMPGPPIEDDMVQSVFEYFKLHEPEIWAVMKTSAEDK